MTVYVDSQTSYRGQVDGFDDLEKGMRAGFAGYINVDGANIARVVAAGYPQADRPDGVAQTEKDQLLDANSLQEDTPSGTNS